jgi:fluoride ion exporter CrcB/FEX
MLERGQPLAAAGYAAASVLGGLLLAFAGLAGGRTLA